MAESNAPKHTVLNPDFSHSQRIPLAKLQEALRGDKELCAAALKVLAVEDPRSTFSDATAISGLLNHWLVNRDLSYYINGLKGENFASLTVLPVDGDYGKGVEALEEWVMIDKSELVALFQSRRLPLPAALLDVGPKTQTGSVWTEHVARASGWISVADAAAAIAQALHPSSDFRSSFVRTLTEQDYLKNIKERITVGEIEAVNATTLIPLSREQRALTGAFLDEALIPIAWLRAFASKNGIELPAKGEPQTPQARPNEVLSPAEPLQTKADIQCAQTETRQDSLSIEIECTVGKLGVRATPMQVWEALRKNSRQDGSCIVSDTPNGLKWERADGSIEVLTLDALKKRLKRMRDKSGR